MTVSIYWFIEDSIQRGKHPPSRMELQEQSGPVEGSRMYQCVYCDEMSDNVEDMLIHVNAVHFDKPIEYVIVPKTQSPSQPVTEPHGQSQTSVASWKCKLCEHETGTQEAQWKHLKFMHKVEVSSEIAHLCIQKIGQS